MDLTITVISGSQLPKKKSDSADIIDPYIKVQIYGLQVDCAEKKTPTVKNNGFNPQWNCKLDFHLKVPEMALIRFVRLEFLVIYNELIYDQLVYFWIQFCYLRRTFIHSFIIRRFTVFDEDQFSNNEKVAQYILPCTSLLPGK